MAMIVQHNMASANTNRMLGIATKNLSKTTEKLSSGYRINRAADDAAGLAISEKMRSQIRGLNQASTNAQNGISMIQTAEGALNETHNIMQRMRELAVQAANGTNTDEDRGNLQDEVAQLQAELDRIAETTEYNEMKLLDGSLGGSGTTTAAGPKFGVYDDTLQAFLSSDIQGVKVTVSATAQAGGEGAIWDETGTELTLYLADKTTYTQNEIDKLIKEAKQEDSDAEGRPANIELNFNNGVLVVDSANTQGGTATTVAGARATDEEKINVSAGQFVGATGITITANKYGVDNNIKINLSFNAKVDGEEFELVTAAQYADTGKLSGTTDVAEYNLKLATGVEYTEEDIEKLLAEAGFSADVEFSGIAPDQPNTLYVTSNTASATLNLTGGTGLGDANAYFGQKDYDVQSGGSGVKLQVGANHGQTMDFGIGNMNALSIGVDATKVNISTQAKAEASLEAIDAGLQVVSKQRAALGAIQNRLEHTIASLDNTAENLQSAESGIRDTDMAAEMVKFSAANIIQQAAQSMLAQANQSTQGVLSLLG